MYCGRSQDFNSRESSKSILGRELSDRPHKEVRWFIALALCSGHFVMLYCFLCYHATIRLFLDMRHLHSMFKKNANKGIVSVCLSILTFQLCKF